MTARLAIQSIGLVGGFGCGGEAALHALQNGGRPNGTIACPCPAGPVEYPAYLADPAPLSEFVSPAKLRRVNKSARLAALAAATALREAPRAIDPARTGVIVATGYGALTATFDYLKDVIRLGDTFASPTQFSNSVHSSAASHVTILLELTGPCLTVVQFEMSVVAAMLNAAAWLADASVDAVLLGAMDEVNDVLVYCYRNFWPEATLHAIQPLDFDRQTAVPGEGAAFMLLTRADEPNAPYGYIESAAWQHADRAVLPRDTLIIAGADGHRASGRIYRQLLHDTDPARINTFSQIYGSLPSGQLFDLALAAIAARNDIIPPKFTSVKTDRNKNLGLITHDNT